MKNKDMTLEMLVEDEANRSKIKTLEKKLNVPVEGFIVAGVRPKVIHTAIRTFSVKELLKLATSVSTPKLFDGLRIIEPIQIETISFERLAIILKHGDMKTLARVQNICDPRQVAKTVMELPLKELKRLLRENDDVNIIDRVQQVIL